MKPERETEEYQYNEYIIGEKLTDDNYADFLAKGFIVSLGDPFLHMFFNQYSVSQGTNLSEFLQNRPRSKISVSPELAITGNVISSTLTNKEISYLKSYAAKFSVHVLVEEDITEFTTPSQYDPEEGFPNVNGLLLHIAINEILSPFESNRDDQEWESSVIKWIKRLNLISSTELILEDLYLDELNNQLKTVTPIEFMGKIKLYRQQKRQ